MQVAVVLGRCVVVPSPTIIQITGAAASDVTAAIAATEYAGLVTITN
jgi:hypothetical protein